MQLPRLTTVMWIVAAGCGGNEHIINDGIDAVPPGQEPTTIVLRFERTGMELDAIASWLDQDGAPILGPAPGISLEADHGTLSGPVLTETGYSAHLVPGGTGVFAITATSGSVTTTRTAVVLASVDDQWGQPEQVRGLVNTAGWEDGASVSPDGETLVLQYLPVPIDCIFGGSASAPACKVIGPIAEPERPDLPGASRVFSDGRFRNGCPTVGLDPLPDNVVVPPNAQWAFTRQRDGSFGKPRAVFYDGIDGCISSFGLIIGPDNQVSWSLDNPIPPDDGAKIHTATLSLEPTTKLGTFTSPGGVLTLTDEPGEQLALGEAEAEGNPFVMIQNGKRVVLFDDEAGRQDLLFATEVGTNTWSAVSVIPDPVSVPGAQESQPFFDGTTLLFRRDVTLLASDWSGGPMENAASWSATRTILAPETTGTPAVGAIVAVGEPSVATVDGVKELYFVYAVREADHLNLDVAFVRAR
jgi:hypothetical protein